MKISELSEYTVTNRSELTSIVLVGNVEDKTRKVTLDSDIFNAVQSITANSDGEDCFTIEIK